jgi:hypothetical protein
MAMPRLTNASLPRLKAINPALAVLDSGFIPKYSLAPVTLYRLKTIFIASAAIDT